MNEEFSIQAIVIVLLVLIGLFVVVRAFVMPSDFTRNQTKRDQVRKRLREIVDDTSSHDDTKEDEGTVPEK